MFRVGICLRCVEQLFQRDLCDEHAILMFRVGTCLRRAEQMFQRDLRNRHAISMFRDGASSWRVEQLFQRDLRDGHAINHLLNASGFSYFPTADQIPEVLTRGVKLSIY